MEYSPLIDVEIASFVKEAISGTLAISHIVDRLSALDISVSVQILRFFSYQVEVGQREREKIQDVWRKLLQADHPLDNPGLRQALDLQSEWWDAFGVKQSLDLEQYNISENLLEQVGHTIEGIGYFRWIALHPMYVRMDDVWDEERRGAIISLARYAYSRAEGSNELFFARHLDDWSVLQADVIEILVAMKSRLLPKIAPWYMVRDPDIRSILSTYF
jgi:hypothetical protein